MHHLKDLIYNLFDKTTLNLNYTHGDDDTQNRPLPQIMPLAYCLRC